MLVKIDTIEIFFPLRIWNEVKETKADYLKMSVRCQDFITNLLYAHNIPCNLTIVYCKATIRNNK